MPPPKTLKRSLSLLLTTCYGVGTILGAGIYVLVGYVAAYAGVFAPLSFLLAAIVATFTALSYAEAASRHPKSAGEATYVLAAFQQKWLAALTGYLVILTGITSAATLVRGFVGYFSLFVPMQPFLVIVLLVLFLGVVAYIGITESAVFATTITLIEVLGLLAVLFIGRKAFSSFSPTSFELHTFSISGVVVGAFLAFYAFIGFEDMVNLAEEVKNPRKTLPKAIVLALVIATLLYLLVAYLAVAALPLKELASSSTPLALIVEKAGVSPAFIALISLFAVVNGALVQIIMSTRVLYGLAKQKNAPLFLGNVSKKRRTPSWATLIVTIAVGALALGFPLVGLAKATSFVILLIFALVNLSVLVLKKKEGKDPEVFTLLYVVPILGFCLSLGLLVCAVATPF